ncbi:MAG: methyltransferase type 11 [Deltaproteobacteria bacterium]|nr:methyltransferase type 11 [Deltaproteobacteria bacterium]
MPPLPPDATNRVDESPDAHFYAMARMVVHIDEATIAALTDYYAEILTPGADVLDLMSSWVSHLPEAPTLGRVAGLGMNAEELAANPRLSESVVHDLNVDPTLPFDDASFDFVVNAVSVQYLTRPLEVFAEIARVLRPGGRSIVAMSHRCFPTKAIRAFHVPGATARFQLVGGYHAESGLFEAIDPLDRSPDEADPLWIVTATRRAD